MAVDISPTFTRDHTNGHDISEFCQLPYPLKSFEEGVRSQESGVRRENCMGIRSPKQF
ncbi:MAG: hypothetical protein F6K18_18855 [Okeania sp. SIO2C2]|uniref:hypothetical protein n=1 Tax=Okeania sp. SIO2C2 TaxID=2607787 RepID=UPI0013B60906|nr:hypothetical protein [Okeania sp. SIO2C2]NEP88729.1 hypothetical protein [Okeania sp. SIO2C2]